jgi:cyanoexosortase A
MVIIQKILIMINKYLKISILFLSVILLLLHLVLISKGNQGNLLIIHVIGLIAIFSSLWQKRQFLDLSSNLFCTIFGNILILFALIRSQMPLSYNPHLSIIFFGFGLSLISSKLTTIKQYKPELLIILFLGLYLIFNKILYVINLPVITAKVASLLLFIFGFSPQQQGTLISLPTGRIEVYGSCSGVDLVILLLFAAYLFILNFPLNLIQKFICFSISLAIALFTNSLRVALLAIFVANNNFNAFNYWHGNDGGWLFSIIALSLLGIFTWYWYLQPLIAQLDHHDY